MLTTASGSETILLNKINIIAAISIITATLITILDITFFTAVSVILLLDTTDWNTQFSGVPSVLTGT